MTLPFRKTAAARSVFLRYTFTNLLVLLPAFIVAVAFFAVASDALSRAADAAAEVQLKGNVAWVDRKLSDLDKMVSQLVVDYRVNQYLNDESELDPVEAYDKKYVSDRLSTVILGGEFLDRCILYLRATDSVIYESGFADYADFYGNLFEVEGYGADGWRALLLNAKSGEISLFPGFMVSSGSSFMPAHFLVRPIGYGENMRGTVVAVVNASELGRRLSRLPDVYGGGIFVFDGNGTLLASSPTEPGKDLAAAASSPDAKGTVSVGKNRFRRYRQVSSANGWQYVALMDESKIAVSARQVRNIAFMLLGAGFFIALALSFGVASSNSKPIIRLFSLVARPQDAQTCKVEGVYSRVENAILNLSDSNTRLEKEIDSALSIARKYFFHNLLRGEYRDRLLFSGDCKRFNIALPPGRCYVIEGRLPSLVAALDGPDRNVMSENFFSSLGAGLAPDEHVIFLSTGAMAVIKRVDASGAYRQEAERFVAGVLASTGPELADGILFGVGAPVEDPFLLSISFGEAEAALASGVFMLRSRIQFYDSLPAPANAWRYPIDAEQAVIKAVRSANGALLESLVNGIVQENFVERTLPPAQSRFLVAAFRGTALRLLGDFADTAPQYAETLNAVGASDGDPGDDFSAIAAVLSAMAEERHRGKRSHNVTLMGRIKEHIAANFRDFNLSLSTIAETFGLSENYLSTFFKEQEGECLYEYIQKMRLNASAALLRDNRAPVDAIAADCGYANCGSFRRAFKRLYGVSPSEFRNRSIRSTIKS